MPDHSPTINRQRVDRLNSFIRLPHGTLNGGYPMIAIADDGEFICHDCCKAELERVYRSTRDGDRNGWTIVGVDTLWEGPPAVCSHCGTETATAYGDPDTAKV